MESNYNNENIERFLRESSDQYRMYPSENVWKNVYNALHTRRRWFGIGLILFLSAGFVTTIMLTNSSSIDHNRAATEKKLLTAPVIKQNTENTQGTTNTPLTPYSSNYVSKDKSSLLKPFALSQNPLYPATINDPEILAESDIKEDFSSTPLVQEKGIVIISEPIIHPDKSEETSVALVPISISITDEATDQDLWLTNNGSFINNVKSGKKEIYNLNRAVSRPLTIESVINSYTRKNKKLSFQYYFTPTISYRKLSQNKPYLRSLNGNSNNSLYGNINNAVTHKPDMGLEVGVAARYALNKNLKIRGGLQFNTSRYDIKAFSYATEIATIALNTGYTVDSVSTISNYRNFNGYKSDWLHNFYFQISAPVGVELKIAGDDKVRFGVAGTIQPTYILGDRAYVLSSNYKNYAEVPWLIRRWNMNTAFEAFVSYSTGKMNWQVGPQVRYQLYSSFVKEYPVKENLFDFGLKIGVSANK